MVQWTYWCISTVKVSPALTPQRPATAPLFWLQRTSLLITFCTGELDSGKRTQVWP